MLINVCNCSNKHSFGDKLLYLSKPVCYGVYSKIIEFKPIPLIALLYVSLVIGLLKNDVTVQGFTDLVCWLAMSKSNKEFH